MPHHDARRSHSLLGYLALHLAEQLISGIASSKGGIEQEAQPDFVV
jgi:hypothetical protein